MGNKSTKQLLEDDTTVVAMSGVSPYGLKSRKLMWRKSKDPFVPMDEFEEAFPPGVNVIPFWQRVAGKYDEQPYRAAPYEGFEHAMPMAPMRDMTAVFYRYVMEGATTLEHDPMEPPPARILVIGNPEVCQILAMSRMFAKSEVHVMTDLNDIPVDRLPKNVRAHARRDPHGISLLQHSSSCWLVTLPFPNGYFDRIHHYHRCVERRQLDWEKLIDHLYRVLAPGGTLEMQERLLLLQHPSGMYGRALNACILKMCQGLGHPGSQFPSTLIRSAEKSGFEIAYPETCILEVPAGPWGGWLGRLIFQHYESKMWTAKPLIERFGGLDSDYVESVLHGWKMEMENPRAKPTYNCFVLVAKKSRQARKHRKHTASKEPSDGKGTLSERTLSVSSFLPQRMLRNWTS